MSDRRSTIRESMIEPPDVPDWSKQPHSDTLLMRGLLDLLARAFGGRPPPTERELNPPRVKP